METFAEAYVELLVAALVLLTGSLSCVQQDLLKHLITLFRAVIKPESHMLG